LIKRENKKRKLWSDLSSLILQEKDSLQQSNTGKQTIPRRYYHSATNKQGGKRKKIKAKTRVHQRPHDQYGTGLLRPETWQLQHFQGEKKTIRWTQPTTTPSSAAATEDRAGRRTRNEQNKNPIEMVKRTGKQRAGEEQQSQQQLLLYSDESEKQR
jgi:hypothetical protein